MASPGDDGSGVIIFDHPLIQHKLGYLRDRATGHRSFRSLMYQIAGLMVFEATRHLPVHDVPIETPMEPMTGKRLSARVTVVPVLRAGLGLAEGIANLRKADATVPIYAAAVDRGLSNKGYILPGLGDAGDRLYGTQ